MADDLFSIKNEFYLGNYMGAINEAQSGDLELSTPADERDRDVIIYRSYLALGQYDVVQDEVKDDAQTALQAVKLLATFKSKPDMKDMVLATLKEWLGDPSSGNNPTLQTVAGERLHDTQAHTAVAAAHEEAVELRRAARPLRPPALIGHLTGCGAEEVMHVGRCLAVVAVDQAPGGGEGAQPLLDRRGAWCAELGVKLACVPQVGGPHLALTVAYRACLLLRCVG